MTSQGMTSFEDNAHYNPMKSLELLKLSSLELASLVAQKQVSPREVLEAHIARIEEVNPVLNALAEQDFDRARQMASQQEKQLLQSAEPLPVFFGVPFTVKEMFAYEGMKRTGGSIRHRDDVMNWDATVVARMKKAGAIPLGTTNVPELGFWFETHNPLYGRTNNPYDITRTCGGSSGGEGALVGAGASPMGLGSDIGGSIRMPASFCGVFGHKPSRHLLPLTGHFPFSRDDFKTLLRGEKYPFTSMGMLTRKATDLYPMLQVLMGNDGYDQETLKNPSLPGRTQNWHKRKVVICPEPVFSLARRTEKELALMVRECGRFLQEMGAEVVELDAKFFARSAELWFAALKSSKVRNLYETLMGEANPWMVTKEILKLGAGRGSYTFPNLVVSFAEMLDRGNKDLSAPLRELAKMKNDLEAQMGDEGLLILPPHPRVAPKHKAPLWSPFDFAYTAIFTVLGMPATSVPTGLSAQGIPLGVQVVAPFMKDHLTLSCAELLEINFKGWQPPHIPGAKDL